MRLQENVGAAKLELTSDDLADLDDILSSMPVQGARYGEQGMKLVGK